jgi:hypothetical protein
MPLRLLSNPITVTTSQAQVPAPQFKGGILSYPPLPDPPLPLAVVLMPGLEDYLGLKPVNFRGDADSHKPEANSPRTKVGTAQFARVNDILSPVTLLESKHRLQLP